MKQFPQIQGEEGIARDCHSPSCAGAWVVVQNVTEHLMGPSCAGQPRTKPAWVDGCSSGRTGPQTSNSPQH